MSQRSQFDATSVPAETKTTPGTLSRDFVNAVKAESIKIAKTPNLNEREQIAKAFTYFFEKILPLDKKENGFLTREGNIDLKEVADLIKLYQDNKNDELSTYLTRNPSYKVIIGILRGVRKIEDVELYLALNDGTRSLPITTPQPKTAEETRKIEEYLGNLTRAAILQNKDLSFMIDALIKGIENNYINSRVKKYDDEARYYRPRIYSPPGENPLYQKADLLEQYYNFVDILQNIKKSNTCTPEQLKAIQKYQPKLVGGTISFMFDHIIRLAKPAHLKEGESYLVRSGAEFRSSWDVHDLHVGAGEPSIDDSNKVHLSFDQNKIQDARNIIIGILEKHKLHSFKIIHKPDSSRNLTGKEVTIYLQIENDYKSGAPEKDPVFWIKLFNELEDALEKIGPNKQFKSQGDKLFPGSRGFIYYRNPLNIIKHYIAADDLRKAGFTSTEAADLCPAGHDPIQKFFKDMRLHEGQEMKKVATPSSTQDRKLTVELKFPDNLAQQQQSILQNFQVNMSKLNSEEVFFGDPPYQIKDRIQPFEKIALILKVAFGYSGIDMPTVTPEIKAVSDPLNHFFMECLKEAAGYVAKANACLSSAGVDLPRLDAMGATGNIIPAVYRHFFNPILAEWIKDPTKSFVNLVDKREFIQAIFKCAFRDKNQINADSPQYISQLTDNQLNQVFAQLAPPVSLKTEAGVAQTAATEMKAETKAAPEPMQASDSPVVIPVDKKDQPSLYEVMKIAPHSEKIKFLNSAFQAFTGLPFQFDTEKNRFHSKDRELYPVTRGSHVIKPQDQVLYNLSDLILGTNMSTFRTGSERVNDTVYFHQHKMIDINLEDAKQLEILCNKLENVQQNYDKFKTENIQNNFSKRALRDEMFPKINEALQIAIANFKSHYNEFIALQSAAQQPAPASRAGLFSDSTPIEDRKEPKTPQPSVTKGKLNP